MILFTWDPIKNVQNFRKHGISFEEAETAFLDENALIYADPDHSDEEDRFILLGFSARTNLLVVVHCYRKNGNEIRIISARKATRRERDYFAEETSICGLTNREVK